MLHDQPALPEGADLDGPTEFFSIGGGKFGRMQLRLMHPTQGSPIVAKKPLGRRIGLQDLAGFGVGDQNGVLSRFEKGTVQRFLLQPRRLIHFHTAC